MRCPYCGGTDIRDEGALNMCHDCWSLIDADGNLVYEDEDGHLHVVKDETDDTRPSGGGGER